MLHLDIDAAKIKNLNEGRITIFEPGLLDMIKRNVTVCKNADALQIAPKWKRFFTAPVKAMPKQSVIFDGQNLYEPSTLNEQELE